MAPAQEDATYPGRARGNGVRMLPAQDDAARRQPFTVLLTNANGVSMVVEVEDGALAIARALHTHPHAAVFDNDMPRPSGIEAALQLRRLQPTLSLNSAVSG